jgi:hypothetical protein
MSHQRARRTGRARIAGIAAAATTVAMFTPLLTPTADAAAPPGAGFTVTAGDLSFILKQIKISERHAATLTASNPCGTLVGPGRFQIPDRLTSYGLRTVDGSCNNLFGDTAWSSITPLNKGPSGVGQAKRTRFGSADEPFPRLTRPSFREADAPGSLAPFLQPGSVQANGRTSYNTVKDVVDSEPRTVSNLIVDQTSTNPAAIAAAEFPVRSQNAPGTHHCTTDPDPSTGEGGVPVGCVPTGQTLFIENVTTDVGLSPPYNSMFTFFGQFFDHGVDQTVKSGATVYVPLKADDPLVRSGRVGPGQDFMVLTRAQNYAGTDGVIGTADDVRDAMNTDSPWVDQSQTYTSHASHQAFLREYVLDPATGRPDATGRLLGGLDAGQTYPG